MLLHLESHLDRCNNLDNQNTSDSISSSSKNKMTSLEKLTIQLQLVAQALHMFLQEQLLRENIIDLQVVLLKQAHHYSLNKRQDSTPSVPKYVSQL